jgi:hypothetical protein
MKMLLTSLLLLTAAGAQASVQLPRADDLSSIRPVSLMEKQHVADPATQQSCKPILLFMRFPDGRVVLFGALKPKNGC